MIRRNYRADASRNRTGRGKFHVLHYSTPVNPTPRPVCDEFAGTDHEYVNAADVPLNDRCNRPACRSEYARCDAAAAALREADR